MIIDVRSENISQQLGEIPKGSRPTAIVARHLGDGPKRPDAVDTAKWLILDDVLPKDFDKMNVAEDPGGSQVAVPLYGYPFGDADDGPEALVRFALQLGVLLALWAESKGTVGVERLLLIHSNVFSRPDGKPGYLVYVGAALKLKPQE